MSSYYPAQHKPQSVNRKWKISSVCFFWIYILYHSIISLSSSTITDLCPAACICWWDCGWDWAGATEIGLYWHLKKGKMIILNSSFHLRIWNLFLYFSFHIRSDLLIHIIRFIIKTSVFPSPSLALMTMIRIIYDSSSWNNLVEWDLIFSEFRSFCFNPNHCP